MNTIKTIKRKLRKRYYWHKNIRARENWSDNDLKKKEPNITARLTDEELKAINDVWGCYLKKKNRLKWFELYKTLWPDAELKFFIPDDFYYMYFDEFYAKRRECEMIDDKNLYDLLFYDVLQPRTIARKVDGVLLSPDYHAITKEQFASMCIAEGKVVVKQSVDSEGGKGVVFVDVSKDNCASLMNSVSVQRDLVVQEVIKQHPELARLHPESINTVRIMTFFFEGKVQVLSSVVRMGVGESRLDNASSGGIVCGINPDGRLKNRAFDILANQYFVHPSGVSFESVNVPGFEECLGLCVDMALRVVKYSRLISWDFAIDENGHPVLIEANLSYGQVDFHQMCNGPIFGAISERVIQYVIGHNTNILR